MHNFTCRFKDVTLACDNAVVPAMVSLTVFLMICVPFSMFVYVARAFLLSFVLPDMDQRSDANK